MVSTRSRLSLCQYLALQGSDELIVLLEKYGIDPGHLGTYGHPKMRELRSGIGPATEEQVLGLLGEVLRTQNALKAGVDYDQYQERWNDLELCLLLDGYRVPRDEWNRINGDHLVLIEPVIEGTVAPEDDLEVQLKKSGLNEAADVLAKLQDSATAFRDGRPQDCLTNARVALQTLATGIALARKAAQGGSFNDKKWGEVAAYLRASALITVEEEEGLCGVFTFLSPGAHVPVGLDQAELARLGRSLAAHMCYFIVKRFNG